jgi:glyoxylase-like metal-dependent hydrolase (beta-lactamase superfamily II)
MMREISAPGDRLRLGDVTVYKIADIERIAWPARALFDGAAASQFLIEGLHFPEAINVASSELILGFNSYVIQGPDYLCLVDAGIGNQKVRHDRPAWHLRSGDFLSRLERIGFRPDQFDLVINTHLHADHVGWNTSKTERGWIPTFPNARYVVPALELDYWRQRHLADPGILHGAYDDSVAPILAAHKYDAVSLPVQVAPGLWLEAAPGHTLHMAVVRLKTEAGELLLLSDVLHSPLQLRLPQYTSRLCVDPKLACETRVRFLGESARSGAIIAAYHFPAPAFGRVVEADGAYDLRLLA